MQEVLWELIHTEQLQSMSWSKSQRRIRKNGRDLGQHQKEGNSLQNGNSNQRSCIWNPLFRLNPGEGKKMSPGEPQASLHNEEVATLVRQRQTHLNERSLFFLRILRVTRTN